MIVTISGKPGTGTSTLAKKFAEKRKLELICAGEVFRQMAKEHEMDVLTFLKYTEEYPIIHTLMDNRIREQAKELGSCVVEGRTAGYIMDGEFNIQLIAPTSERVRRIAIRDCMDEDEALDYTLEREEEEARTFATIYGLDINEQHTGFDVIVNTNTFNINQTLEIIDEAYGKYLLGTLETLIANARKEH